MLLHVLSHCAKAADRIKKNNDRLRVASGGDAPALDAVPKDQGFTRAKVGGCWLKGGCGCWHAAQLGLSSGLHVGIVCLCTTCTPTPLPPPHTPPRQVLVLLPQRNLALRLVTRLLALAVKETRTDTIQNKQRFLEEFGGAGGRGDGCGDGGAMMPHWRSLHVLV